MQTDLVNRCLILADLWANYRGDKELKDFMEFNDLGLPLAYMAAEGLADPTEGGEKFIHETFEMFLEALGIEDMGFEGLADIFIKAGWEQD